MSSVSFTGSYTEVKPTLAHLQCNIMRRSIRKFNIPPGQPPGHLNFWRLPCSNSLPSGKESRSNAPPISTGLPLLKVKCRCQSTLFTLFKERYAVMTPSNFVQRPFWKNYSVTKAKFYLVYPSNPAKTEKTDGRITSEQEINLVQTPHPSNATFKSPPPWARCTVKCPGYARGGVLKFRIDRRITSGHREVINPVFESRKK